MKSIQLGSTTLSLLFVVITANASPTEEALAEIARIASNARYMEPAGEWQKVSAEDFASADWLDCIDRPEFRKFSYSKTPKGWSDQVELSVITYSPTGERAAKWVANSVEKQLGYYDHEIAVQFALSIMGQSGFQFPVRGLVYEGPVYTFVDGVTATLRDIDRAGWVLTKNTDVQNTELLNKVFHAKPNFSDLLPDDLDNGEKRVGRFGRVCSLERTRKPGDSGYWFFKYVRDAHKEAMNGDTNILFERRLQQFQKMQKNGERLADTILFRNGLYVSDGKVNSTSLFEKLESLKIDEAIVKTVF